jgi:hypothetical protein
MHENDTKAMRIPMNRPFMPRCWGHKTGKWRGLVAGSVTSFADDVPFNPFTGDSWISQLAMFDDFFHMICVPFWMFPSETFAAMTVSEKSWGHMGQAARGAIAELLVSWRLHLSTARASSGLLQQSKSGRLWIGGIGSLYLSPLDITQITPRVPVCGATLIIYIYSIYIWLVVWKVFFPYIEKKNHPLICFKRVWNHQPDTYILYIYMNNSQQGQHAKITVMAKVPFWKHKQMSPMWLEQK